MRALIHELASDAVPRACARALEAITDEADTSVWFIRRLQLELVLDAGRVDTEEIARVWGEQLAVALVRKTAGGACDEEVVEFASREDYVARFIADLAEGVAFRRWYYASFDSLRALSRDAAVREALVREPSITRGVLGRLLSSGKLDPVLRAMTARGAGIVLHTAAMSGSPGVEGADAIEILLAVDSTKVATSVEHAALRLFVMSGFRVSETIARSFAAVVQTLRGRGPEAGPAVADELSRLVASRITQARRGTSGELDALVIESPHVSVFMLLPAVLEAADPELLETPEKRVALFAECLQAPVVDPAIALAAGFEGTPEPTRIPPVDDIMREAAVAALRAFASHLLGFQRSSVEFLRENFFCGSGTVRILRDWMDVELPAVPLGIVLRLAGYHGRRLDIPWLKHVVLLRLPEESV